MRDHFQCKLDKIFRIAVDAGWPAVVVQAGDVHRMAGGYPGPANRGKVWERTFIYDICCLDK